MESYTGAERAGVLFVVSRTAIAHFLSEKIQDHVSRKTTPTPPPPQRMAILALYNRFVKSVCVSQMHPGAGRLCVEDETIENVRQTFARRPRKSTKCASLE